MKILQINSVFRNGSTGKLAASLHDFFRAQGIESVVCYGRKRSPAEPGVYKISSEWEAKLHSLLSRLFSVDFGYSPLATRRLIHMIRSQRPDIVHLHCLNAHFVNVYRLLNFLKKEKIPTVLTLHAEIMHTAGCEHAGTCEKWRTACTRCKRIEGKISRFFRDDAAHCYRKMQRAVDGFGTLTAVGVSDWLTERARHSPIFRDVPCVTVLNGVNTEIFRYADPNELRRRLNISEENILLHVTPNFNHPIKGGRYVLELAERMPDCRFLIVGFNGDPTALPANVTPVARTQDQKELAAYYSLADVTLLTSKRETFSMITAESLCCGTPVAGFLAGAPETFALTEGSGFVPFGDVAGLERVVRGFLAAPPDKATLSRTACDRYADRVMAEGYLALYHSVQNNG